MFAGYSSVPALAELARNPSLACGFADFYTPSRNGLQNTVGGFELDPKEPIEMEFLTRQPLFEFFAVRRVEFDKHFSFLHIDHNPKRRKGFRG
jgi:hypothetical protein